MRRVVNVSLTATGSNRARRRRGARRFLLQKDRHIDRRIAGGTRQGLARPGSVHFEMLRAVGASDLHAASQVSREDRRTKRKLSRGNAGADWPLLNPAGLERRARLPVNTFHNISNGPFIASWCNGSTSDSGSLCHGSNPCEAAMHSVGNSNPRRAKLSGERSPQATNPCEAASFCFFAPVTAEGAAVQQSALRHARAKSRRLTWGVRRVIAARKSREDRLLRSRRRIHL